AGVAAGGSSMELAAANARPQAVVSAIEGGPTVTHTPAAPKRPPRPTPHPAAHLASNRNPVNAPAPEPKVVEPAPQPEPRATEPAPAPEPVQRPAPAPVQQQRGVYKSEAEIFRQMPWIRP